VPTTPSGRGNRVRVVVPRSPTPMGITPSPTNELLFRPTLDVSPLPPVDVDQQVTFTVVPKLPGAVEYRFNFGDGKTSDWITEPRTTHQYGATKLYWAYAEIRRREGRLARGRINTARKEVQVRPRSNPTPSATSARITPSPPSYTPSATASATASVSASPSSYSPSPTAIVSGGSTTAAPLGSSPSVASPTATSSPPEQYTATPTPVPPDGGSASQKRWWVFYIISAGLAAAGLYVIPKLIKPTFHPHADWHEPQSPPKNLAINYGLYFHSNLSAGQDRLETDGASSILRKKKQ
jgi:hypothetical protein